MQLVSAVQIQAPIGILCFQLCSYLKLSFNMMG